MTMADAILDTAIGWHVRQETMAAEDWHAFVAWLEADPRHAAAFDAVSLDDARRHPAMPVAANDDAPVRRWGWIAGGVAAAAALVLAVPALRPAAGDARYDVSAQAPRTERLADGTEIAMATGARMTFDRDDARYARLDAGRATFRVVHDADRPFELRVGAWAIRDVGTVFTVTRAPRRLDLAVSEGVVLFDPAGAAVKVGAGHALTIGDGDGAPVLTAHDPDRHRALRFAGQPMPQVVQTVARTIGADIALSPALAGRQFTGAIRLTGSAEQDIPHFAEMTGTRWSREGNRWNIAPAEGSR